jgi:fluoride ion exporter CrcB/FEX
MDFGWIALQILLGALGAVTRFGVMTVISPGSWNRGLFTVNAVGSFLVGAAVGIFSTHAISWAYTALVLAFCAGLTTFSTLAVDTARHIERREFRAGVTLITSQVLIGVLLAAVGYISTSALFA